MTTNEPPDEWDEQIAVQPRASTKKRQAVARPVLSADEEDARRAWVFAMRSYHERQSGEPSRYDSSPVWDGGRCSQTGRVYQTSIWPGFVAKARAAGYSPRELVDALFSSWSSDTAPTPHAALAESNLHRASVNRLLRRRRVSDALRTEEAIYRAEVWGAMQSTPDKHAASRFVLNDTSRILSPLFRYSVAVISQLPDVAERWKSAATAQFQSDAAAYLEFWSALIPESMKQSAQSAA